MSCKVHWIVFKVRSIVISKHSFRGELGSLSHKKALEKAIKDFENVLGPDLFESDFMKYVTLKE